MLYLLFALVVLCWSSNLPKAERFTLYDDAYVPKTWKLIPRTVTVPASERKSMLGVTPDDFFSFIPPYTGSVLPGQTFKWSGECFQDNTATLTVHDNDSYVFTVKLENKKSLFCTEGFLFAYIGQFQIEYFEFDGSTDISFNGPMSTAQVYDMNHLGIRMFTFPSGVVMTGTEIYETILLFFGGLIGAHVPEWTAEDNLQFLKDHMNVTMPVRSITDVAIPMENIKSGDFLGVIRLDGLDPMLAWAMGSHTGHTCITIWINGTLYVAESTVKSEYWPTDGIQITPWNTWIAQAKAANYNVVHLPLDPKVAAKFDVNKAIAFFNTVKGLPYGFHNLFTGWIDTDEDNYPSPLSSHLVQLLAPFAEWLLQKEIGLGQTFDFLAQGLNKRLGTSGLNVGEAYMAASEKNISFSELINMPELDIWVFTNDNSAGRSMVCDSFVTEMWKAGGLFGEITDMIQGTEFTNFDAYSLNIFDANYVRPSQCVTADPDSPFCQILGQYRMSLPGYNTAQPFPHMREKCPSEPPLYIRPPNC